jgi:5,10-methylene-tetrahydrofolate dehydrogenase/methenyl tetrahydrofolate cyclohydrolase
MIEILKAEGASVTVCDPYYDSPDLSSAVKDSDVVVLATNHAAFLGLDFLKSLSRSQPPPILVDCWGAWDEEQVRAAGVQLITFGRGDHL